MPKRSLRSLSFPLLDMGFKRKRVKNDGSCWVYAVLAGLKQCDHALQIPWKSGKVAMLPTDNDIRNDKRIRAEIFILVNELGGNPIPDEYSRPQSLKTFLNTIPYSLAHFKNILKSPDYEGKRNVDQFLGSFGNGLHTM